ncbi:MAG: 30S ribosomal protein S18 [Holosporales bacterium]|jgi:small subunit ribosomal protein S18|nr:30S ribosomal protein S18 [Holosporales bacterium]
MNRGNFEKNTSRTNDARNATDRANTLRKQQIFKGRGCPFSGKKALQINYKDVAVLSKFLSERGKIIPSRVTSVCFKKQRELAKAIKRARFLALIPYVND